MLRLFLLSLCVLLSLGSAYAKEDAAAEPSKEKIKTYNVYSDIDMLSTIKLRYGKNMFIKSVYPQLTSTTDDEYLDTFNLTVTDLIEEQVTDFKQRVTDNAANLASIPKAQRKNNLYIDYDTSVVKAGAGDHVVGIRFSMQGMVAGMAHPYRYHRSINYILETGETVELNDLFKPDTNYLEIFARYTREALARRHLPDAALLYSGTAPDANNYSIWNLRDRGILITFDNNQVAPSIYGPQTVLIPYSILKEVVAPESVIFDCVSRRRSCASNGLLTGGFIDEASKDSRGPSTTLGMTNKLTVNTPHRRFNPILSQR